MGKLFVKYKCKDITMCNSQGLYLRNVKLKSSLRELPFIMCQVLNMPYFVLNSSIILSLHLRKLEAQRGIVACPNSPAGQELNQDGCQAHALSEQALLRTLVQH